MVCPRPANCGTGSVLVSRPTRSRWTGIVAVGDAWATTAWNRRIAMDTARRKDPDVMRGFAEVACLLATPREALVKSGLMEEIAALGAGASRYTGLVYSPCDRHRNSGDEL